MKKSLVLRTAVIFLSFTAFGALFILGIFSNFGFLLARSTPFPIDMHSSAQANYQKDPDYMQIEPMDIQLVIDAIWDQNLDSQALSTRLTQVNDNFLAAVASVTPRPTATDTSTPEMLPSATPGGPTVTIGLTPSFTPTETPPGFISSPTSTDSAFTSTSTVSSPTDTLPVATNTALPPTNTVSPCGQLAINGFASSTKKASWQVVNNSPTSVSLNSVSIFWPASNGDLTKVFFGSAKIWDKAASPPSLTFNPGSQVLPGNSSKKLEFFFVNASASSGYTLTINLSGCPISKSN